MSVTAVGSIVPSGFTNRCRRSPLGIPVHWCRRQSSTSVGGGGREAIGHTIKSRDTGPCRISATPSCRNPSRAVAFCGNTPCSHEQSALGDGHDHPERVIEWVEVSLQKHGRCLKGGDLHLRRIWIAPSKGTAPYPRTSCRKPSKTLFRSVGARTEPTAQLPNYPIPNTYSENLKHLACGDKQSQRPRSTSGLRKEHYVSTLPRCRDSNTGCTQRQKTTQDRPPAGVRGAPSGEGDFRCFVLERRALMITSRHRPRTSMEFSGVQSLQRAPNSASTSLRGAGVSRVGCRRREGGDQSPVVADHPVLEMPTLEIHPELENSKRDVDVGSPTVLEQD
ncbi:hypothetical protein RUM43_015110 [Polyplax serrata]|uniref:Uncharacterized protein n=1 Tax=Polyplax serrata TaxID=468196 RepID=A0AAN8PPV4_POLSC